MKLYESIIHSAIISASIVADSLLVCAAIVTYIDRYAFLADLFSSPTDNYNNLTTDATIASPLSRSIPGCIYSAAANGGLFNDVTSLSRALSTRNSTSLALAFATGALNAVGGYFFNTDEPFNLLNRVITVTANPGASAQSVVTGSATNFFGWLDDSGTPFTSLVIVPATGFPAAYPTVDDLILGKAAPPVLGSLPVIGAAAAIGFSRRLRSRIAAAHPRG